MINEEDHLRMQAIRPGFQLDNAYAMLNAVDDELEDRLDFAYDIGLGFLTACPTNVGTGMRASAMLHLPGLVLADQMNQVIQGVNKIGLVVRGIHGEGTEALGNLFQVSNQITLGHGEEQILNMLDDVIRKMLDHEQNARESLLESKPGMLQDQIGRAYGILRYAHSMNSKEALNLLSLMKLGVDLGAFPTGCRLEVDGLFTVTQPAHLQRLSDQKLSADERDRMRATLIRDRLKSFPSPDKDIKAGESSADKPGTNDE
jgi:protein arginine kinase